MRPKDKVEDNKKQTVYTKSPVRAVMTRISQKRENIWNKTRRTQERG